MIEKLLLQTKNGDALSAELHHPPHPKAVITLAHGAGAGMHHPFMVALANELFHRGVACLRYNFLYMEQKKRRPDFPAVAHQAVAAALLKSHELFPSLPVFASGKSFGGRMSSQHLALTSYPFVKGIIFFGFPLHPAGKPSLERAEHLSQLRVPMLFIQGTKDELAQWNLLTQVLQSLPGAEVFALEGADHSFKKGKENLVPVIAEAAELWIKKCLMVTP